MESQQQLIANQSTQQQQQHQLRSTSHPNLPLSQGSDWFIHRSDTILTHQPSHSPFSQPQSQSLARDRDTSSSSHTQSNIHSLLSSVNPSSSSSAPPPPLPLPLKSQFLIPQSIVHINVHNRHKAHLLPSLL